MEAQVIYGKTKKRRNELWATLSGYKSISRQVAHTAPHRNTRPEIKGKRKMLNSQRTSTLALESHPTAENYRRNVVLSFMTDINDYDYALAESFLPEALPNHKS